MFKIWALWVTTEWCFRSDKKPSILSPLRAVKLAWTGVVVQETSDEGDPQSNVAAESSGNVVKGHVRLMKLAVESALSVEVPADHDLLTWLVPYAASMHREMWEGALFRPWHSSVNECGGCLCSNRTAVLDPLDSRFEQGRYLGPMAGSNTVLIGTASGVVKARTTKRLLPGERWLDEALGSELTPNALEDDGGRVGIREPVLHPHEAVPCPHLYLNF